MQEETRRGNLYVYASHDFQQHPQRIPLELRTIGGYFSNNPVSWVVPGETKHSCQGKRTLATMGKRVEFVVVLDDGVRKRHYHETDKGKVLYFAVQLEVRVGRDWKPVVRYDCSHRFSHMDKYDIMGNKTKIPLDLGFESALTFGEWDIDENWSRYKEDFLKGGQHG